MVLTSCPHCNTEFLVEEDDPGNCPGCDERYWWDDMICWYIYPLNLGLDEL